MSNVFLSAHWENLVMANYTVDTEWLKSYLPHGVEFDLYEEKAYVSLVGFLFKNTRFFRMPIPFFGTFEEINLRFYVKRKEGDTVKRGVVFINETVPYRAVAWVANRFYKEHYSAVPTRSETVTDASGKKIRYEWKVNRQWNHLSVSTLNKAAPMLSGSIEAFIFEHYYGYTRVNEQQSQEYRVNHPRWEVNKVLDYSIHCDFKAMYGDRFAALSHQQPASVMMAIGSPVTIAWKRNTF